MNTEILYRNNIFLIPIGSYLDAEDEAYCLVYSPLAGKMLVADKEGLEELPDVLPELVVDGDAK